MLFIVEAVDTKIQLASTIWSFIDNYSALGHQPKIIKFGPQIKQFASYCLFCEQCQTKMANDQPLSKPSRPNVLQNIFVTKNTVITFALIAGTSQITYVHAPFCP